VGHICKVVGAFLMKGIKWVSGPWGQRSSLNMLGLRSDLYIADYERKAKYRILYLFYSRSTSLFRTATEKCVRRITVYIFLFLSSNSSVTLFATVVFRDIFTLNQMNWSH
jgi:hypothetical protein